MSTVSPAKLLGEAHHGGASCNNFGASGFALVCGNGVMLSSPTVRTVMLQCHIGNPVLPAARQSTLQVLDYPRLADHAQKCLLQKHLAPVASLGSTLGIRSTKPTKHQASSISTALCSGSNAFRCLHGHARCPHPACRAPASPADGKWSI